MFKIFQKLFSKTNSSARVLENLTFSSGMTHFKLSGTNYVLDTNSCTFYDKNAVFDVNTAKTHLNSISIEDSDVFYLEYSRKLDRSTNIAHFRETIDNSKSYKKLNREFLESFYKVKNDTWVPI